MDTFDTSASTIAAVATAPGRGGVAVVRVSGPDAWKVAEKISGRSFGREDAGRFFFSRFRNPHLPGGIADEGLVLLFKAPSSYTGEDVVEFHGHGGSVAPRRVLDACFAAGARLARRGEFTERAFLNGKLDLSAAEAVIDLVDARTDRAAADAQARLRGELSGKYEALYGSALELSSRMEHLLDVSEDEIPAGELETLAKGVGLLRRRIASLAATAREGRILREGALVVLAGAPNAGKSSLMNALLGENRAIVSAQAGTTRDSIEEGLELDGWPIRLTDTAGIRETGDAIEAEGVQRAERLAAQADLTIALDCDLPGALKVHAKCDLDLPSAGGAMPGRFLPDGTLRISAHTREGLDELRREIVRRLERLAAAGDEASGDATARQKDLLERAEAALDGVAETGGELDLVLAANALRSASASLGEILGKTYSDDLLDALFSRFCVGK